MILGLSLNVYRSASAEILPKDSFFGDDVGVVASVGLAFSEGVRAQGVLPVVGHYPGLGAATWLEDGSLAIVDGHETLAEEVIFPFARAADNDVAGLLVGHVAVPALDEDTPARSAALSRRLVNTLLRDVWSYDGLAISDDVTKEIAVSGRAAPEVVVDALMAGCDGVMLGGVSSEGLEAICQAVVEISEESSVFRERLEAGKVRLSRHVAMLGEAVPQPSGTERILHTIQQGESLITIARRYRIYVDDLMAWNGLTDSEIRFGQRLILYLPEDDHEEEVVAESVIEEESAPVAEVSDESSSGEEVSRVEEVSIVEAAEEEPVEALVEETVGAIEEPNEIIAPEGVSEDRGGVGEEVSAEEAVAPAAAETVEEEASEPVEPTMELAEEHSAREEASGASGEELTVEDGIALEDESSAEEALEPVKVVEELADDISAEESAEEISEGSEGLMLPEEDPVSDTSLDAFDVENPGDVVEEESTDTEVEYGFYTIQRGDRLHEVAVKLGTTKVMLIELNDLGDANLIKVGQRLKYPMPSE